MERRWGAYEKIGSEYGYYNDERDKTHYLVEYRERGYGQVTVKRVKTDRKGERKYEIFGRKRISEEAERELRVKEALDEYFERRSFLETEGYANNIGKYSVEEIEEWMEGRREHMRNRLMEKLKEAGIDKIGGNEV